MAEGSRCATPPDLSAGLTVVKIGGSLAEGPAALTAWLGAVARGRGRVVVVPGGGQFADAVRQVQAGLGFDDATAHRMALLAMEQYGLALCALASGFTLARTRGEILVLAAGGQIPVWAPTPMALGAPEIPESWAVTSDSLAAWLAARLGVRRLVLVKSAPRPSPGTSLEAAIAHGLVDQALADFAVELRELVCLGPGDEALLASALTDGAQLPGALTLAHRPVAATAAVAG